MDIDFLSSDRYKVGLAMVGIFVLAMVFLSGLPRPSYNVSNDNISTTNNTSIPIGIRLIYKGNQSNLTYADFEKAKDFIHSQNESFCGFLISLNETLPNDCHFENKTIFVNETNVSVQTIRCIWDNETDEECNQ